MILVSLETYRMHLLYIYIYIYECVCVCVCEGKRKLILRYVDIEIYENEGIPNFGKKKNHFLITILFNKYPFFKLTSIFGQISSWKLKDPSFR